MVNKFDVPMGWDLQGSWTRHRFQTERRAGARDGGSIVSWSSAVLRCKCGSEIEDTVTGHVHSCGDALESQTKVLLRQQFYSAGALENPSQDWEKGFCVTSKLNWWCHLYAKGWELNRVHVQVTPWTLAIQQEPNTSKARLSSGSRYLQYCIAEATTRVRAGWSKL